MFDLADYRGLHVRKTAGDPADPDAVWYIDHRTNEMSLKPFAGATFLNELSLPTDEAPAKIVLGTDYVEREPWIETVGLHRNLVAGGPPEDPYQVVHNFPECSQLVFHMIQHDYHYDVVQQPGKDKATGEVRNYYLAELVETRDPSGHDTSTGWSNIAGPGRSPEYAPISTLQAEG